MYTKDTLSFIKQFRSMSSLTIYDFPIIVLSSLHYTTPPEINTTPTTDTPLPPTDTCTGTGIDSRDMTPPEINADEIEYILTTLLYKNTFMFETGYNACLMKPVCVDMLINAIKRPILV